MHDLNLMCVCVQQKERQRKRVSEYVCMRLLAHISISWFGLVKRLATFKSATCEYSQEVHCKKPVLFICFVCSFLLVCSLVRSVSQLFPPFFLWLCTMLLLLFFSARLFKMLRFRSMNVIPMLYRNFFIMFHVFLSFFFIYSICKQTEIIISIHQMNVIRYYYYFGAARLLLYMILFEFRFNYFFVSL